jgi:hypothetical protein
VSPTGKSRDESFAASVYFEVVHDDGDAMEVVAREHYDEAMDALAAIRALVDEQAEDEGLWAIYPMGQQPIMEAYLQQELRRLHALIEGVT